MKSCNLLHVRLVIPKTSEQLQGKADWGTGLGKNHLLVECVGSDFKEALLSICISFLITSFAPTPQKGNKQGAEEAAPWSWASAESWPDISLPWGCPLWAALTWWQPGNTSAPAGARRTQRWGAVPKAPPGEPCCRCLCGWPSSQGTGTTQQAHCFSLFWSYTVTVLGRCAYFIHFNF